jgi:hypothetical protein
VVDERPLFADTVEKAVKYSLVGKLPVVLERLEGFFSAALGPPSSGYAANISGSIFVGLKRASRVRFWAVAARIGVPEDSNLRRRARLQAQQAPGASRPS